MTNSNNIVLKLFLVVLLLFVFIPALPQTDSLLLQINQEHLHFKQNGMTVLGGWALTNLAISGTMMTQTKGVNYRFHEMNVFWNVINLGIAGFGFYDAMNGQNPTNLIQTLSSQQDFGKILLFNAGLDVGYVMSGFFLRERSKNVSKFRNRLKGYGNSIIIQGSFLFVFDLVLYSMNENRIAQWLESNELSVFVSPSSIGLSMHF